MSASVLILSHSPPPFHPVNPRPKPKPQLPLFSRPFPSPNSIPSLIATSPPSLRSNTKHLSCTPLRSLPSSQQPPIPLLKTLTKPLSFPQITPFSICKWSLILSLVLTLSKKTISTLTSPFFWTYFSFTWVFWPYIGAVALAGLGLYSYYKHSKNQSSIFHQLAIVTSVITWLTLVPPAHFNGFLEGWPIALFFVYHYYFFFESSVRKRLYGDLYPRAHDPKWDVGLPKPFQIAFFVLVLVGHFLAAYEGPEMHLISGGWANFGTWVLVLVTIFTRYHSILYLAKYSEKVAVPTAVVQFGPYRWVRHPIYASTLLLFALHCITLRSPLSLAFLVAVCVWYYGRKAELEEELMVDMFGERYREYMGKVRYRLIPFLY